MDLPVLDITDQGPGVAKALVDAVSKFGFVYIKSEGLNLNAADVDNMFATSKEFFDQPNDAKAQYSVKSGTSGSNGGWLGLHGELLDPEHQQRGDFKESFNMNEFRDGKAQQPLPPVLQNDFAQLNDFVNKCRDICIRILRLFAIGIGIEEDWFAKRHDTSQGLSGSVFRLLYYPKVDESKTYDNEKDIRAGAHSDYGTITLLFQRPGQPGLEIRTDDEKEQWSPVEVNPTSEPSPPILVNIGDLLEYWTNGLLRSTVHRVVFPRTGGGDDRYSIAYFCHPFDDAELIPVPSEMVSRRPPIPMQGQVNGGILTAKQHLERRLAGTYTWEEK